MDSNYAQPAGHGRSVVWGVLRRQRWLIVVCALLGVAVGSVLARRVETVYTAAASIEADGGAAGLTPLSAPGAAKGESQIATELQLLQSHSLAQEVADTLQLRLQVTEPRAVPRGSLFASVRVADSAPEGRYRLVRDSSGRFAVTDAATGARVGRFAPGDRIPLGGGELVLARGAAKHPEIEVKLLSRAEAAGTVIGGLDIQQPSRDAGIIRIVYSGADPEIARDVPNTLAARFIAMRKELRTRDARTTAQFLRGQLDTLRGQLSSAEDRLRAFREREQVVDLPVEAGAQVSRQAQMQAERATLEAERSSLGSLLAEARRESSAAGGPSPYRKLAGFPSLLRNPVAVEMLSSLTRLENERSALLTRRKPTDPEVMVYTTRISELENQLASIVTTYQQGLARQVNSMDATLGGFERQMDRVPGKEMEMARLTRNTKALDEYYGLLQTRLKEAEISEAVQDPSVRMVDTAGLGEPGASRKNLLVAALGGFGLLLGIALGFVREYRDGTVRSREDLVAATALPVLGWIPMLGTAPAPRGRLASTVSAARRLLPANRARAAAGLPARVGSEAALATPLLAAGEASHVTSDAYEWLHRNVLFAQPDAEVKSILVTSPLPGDGKSTTAAGLAVTLARQGLKVLLVDGDLRRGTLTFPVRGSRQRGLSDLLAGAAPFQDVLRTADVGGGNLLHYIPFGAVPPDPTRLLSSPRAAALMEWLRGKYYLVILDSPPLNLFADAAVLGGHADAVVLVARAGVTPFDALVHSAEQCRRAHLPVLGTVLNGFDPERDAAYDPAYEWYGYAKQYYAATPEA